MTVARLRDLMMAVLREPQKCYSLRESRCFCNCLFFRHPWEFGAVGMVKIRHLGHLLKQIGATHLQREK